MTLFSKKYNYIERWGIFQEFHLEIMYNESFIEPIKMSFYDFTLLSVKQGKMYAPSNLEDPILKMRIWNGYFSQ